jgi:hypothetical protein
MGKRYIKQIVYCTVPLNLRCAEKVYLSFNGNVKNVNKKKIVGNQREMFRIYYRKEIHEKEN